MTNIKDIKQTLLNYIAALGDAEKKIPDFEKRANAFSEQLTRREAIQDEIYDLQQQAPPLESELASLKEPYVDALYQQDVAKQREIQQRKKSLERQLKELDKDIETVRERLEPVDTLGLAELKAEMDSFRLPPAWIFLRDIQQPLQNAVRDLESQVETIGKRLPSGHNKDHYRSVRMGMDGKYRKDEQEMERVRERSLAEKPPKTLREANDTSSFLSLNGLVSGEGQNNRIRATVAERGSLDDD